VIGSGHVEASVRVNKSKTWKILLVVLAVLATLAAMALGAWGMFFGFERPIRPEDKQVFVTFDRLAEKVPGLLKAPNSETTGRTRYFDGSLEVEYEYEDDNLSISSSVNHELTTRDARQLFTVIRLALPAATKLATDVQFVPRSDLYSGPDVYCVAIVSSGTSTGHALVVLDGKNVFTLVIGGAFLGDPGEFRALVQPRLDAMKRLY
jgi:hypothetical protein